jgi:DNA-binding NarL/FixJ family response regulator
VLRAGGDGYILKQEDPLEIINAMRDVLNVYIYVSEVVLTGGRSKSPSARKTRSLDQLTDFELEILKLLGEGRSDEEMARQFRMTVGEINARCLQIQHTLGLKSINALIRYAVCRLEKITN